VAVVGERERSELPDLRRSTAYVQVLSAREAWGWLCAAWHDFPSRKMTLIGITGTDGKTTTVNLVYSILRAAGFNAGMLSTVSVRIGEEESDTGLHTTTPDPPEIQRYLSQMVQGGATHAVLEVTSHGLAQHRVAGCDFDVAVVTNVTHEHLDYHGSVEAYRQAKTRLFTTLSTSFRKPGVSKVSVLNRDDDSFRYLRPLPADCQIVYSVDRDADVTAHDVVLELARTQFTLCTPAGRLPVETSLIGRHNVHNNLAAAAVGVALGVSPETIAMGLTSVRAVPGRMERVDEGQPFLAVVDFAHTPNALRQALRTARGMIDAEGRVIVVFGSAGLRDREKRRMMGSIAGQLADVMILTAEDPRTESLEAIMAESAEAAEAEGKREGVDLFRVADRGEAIWRACQLARPGDLVIACGKGHEQSMCFGRKEYPWDDRKAMRLALHGERLDTLPTAMS
ncbi:MAG: UDP-N-acetylmuramoyl-L-alanyl-D-glutamate--2,6-diaminopimelate ligase, partial [Anaerolineae bacterium]|jgi:UDP-N-acetylmuramoyl-L-alanyl-D-glutamate--2,6-diaminopimelate ligase